MRRLHRGHGPTFLEATACALPDQVLLDVGAGAGDFSLAAAARGHRAIAFELSNASLASFEASIAYNGFGKLISLHKVGCGPETLSMPSPLLSLRPLSPEVCGKSAEAGLTCNESFSCTSYALSATFGHTCHV